MPVVLRRPDLGDENALRRACSEVQCELPELVPFYSPETPFPEWLARLDAVREGTMPCAAGVPFTLLLGFAGDDIVGSLSLRHALTDALRQLGGHIGFFTMPKHRRRGVASAMLDQALVFAEEMGLKRVLLTCDEGNEASRRTIERCGGTLQNVIIVPGRADRVMRFWVSVQTAPQRR